MQLVIKPGTGPLAGATKDHAWANIEKLIEDTGLEGVSFKSHPTADNDDGRFAFILRHEGRESIVDMPGIPLERVRWLDRPEQDILHFPRLYVDGSSWIWKFAVNVLKEALTGEE